jgi:hypothetical protein
VAFPSRDQVPRASGASPSQCNTGEFFTRTSPVEIIWLCTSVAARDLARPFLDHLWRHSSYSFGATKDFPAVLCFIHGSIGSSRHAQLAAGFQSESTCLCSYRVR